jgi:hypothetical protein
MPIFQNLCSRFPNNDTSPQTLSLQAFCLYRAVFFPSLSFSISSNSALLLSVNRLHFSNRHGFLGGDSKLLIFQYVQIAQYLSV